MAELDKKGKHVVFCVPTVTKPYQCTLDSIRASLPMIDAAGWAHSIVYEVGSPYISCARATMLRKALDAMATHIVFIDHDISWDAPDLLALIEADGDVVAGNYRFKKDEVDFMGMLMPDIHGVPQVRADGGVKALFAPAGFLRITRTGVARFIAAYPELCFGDKCAPCVDLFNHGAWEGKWYGEDFAFSRRWRDLGGEITILPRLNIVHHSLDAEYGGTFHDYLLRQPGGSEDPDRV
jgi:hypothetical protein